MIGYIFAPTGYTLNNARVVAFGEDGWVSWMDHPPSPHVVIECRRGDGPILKVRPKTLPPEFNVANLFWRPVP